jgi:hypothetical protein
VSFAAITLCVAYTRVFVVVSVYIVIDSVRELLDTPSCIVASNIKIILNNELERMRKETSALFFKVFISELSWTA